MRLSAIFFSAVLLCGGVDATTTDCDDTMWNEDMMNATTPCMDEQN